MRVITGTPDTIIVNFLDAVSITFLIVVIIVTERISFITIPLAGNVMVLEKNYHYHIMIQLSLGAILK